MDRTEPTLGNLDAHVGRTHHYPAPQVIVYGPSVWKIALGVALGMLMFAVISWLVAMLLGSALLYGLSSSLSRQASAPRRPHVTQSSPMLEQAKDTYRPLANDERCINHQRFKRIDSGWVQVGNDC